LKIVVLTVSENLMPKGICMEKYVMYGDRTRAIRFTR